MKRVLLFITTNLAVMVVLSIVMSLVFAFFGINTRDLTGILVIAFIFGFCGSFVSLMLSKWVALRSVGGFVIEEPSNDTERWIMRVVERQAQQLELGMPTVAIYEANDMNAFATGARRNSSLVAVSTGLLDNMTQDEVEAVIAHEMSHVANGDMVTMALMQGVINTFVIFISRILANVITNALNNRSARQGIYFMTVMILELVFGFLASFITMWYSRRREFYADAGAAKLVGKQKMIAALERLKTSYEPELEGSMMAFGINGKKTMMQLLMSHPPLDKRIEALKQIL